MTSILAGMKKGMFIVIDGIDGSGKATQARLLTERLGTAGIACEKIDFPRHGTPVFGELISECLAGKRGDFVHMDPKIASTLYALDRFEASAQIRQWLAEGKVVIADRFTSANQIHQAGKLADVGERTAFLAWLDRVEHEVLGIPRPDAVVYLRVPAEISEALLEKKREAKNAALGDAQKDTVEKSAEYVRWSAESADQLAATNPNWKTVECMKEGNMRTPEDIHEEVYALVQSLV